MPPAPKSPRQPRAGPSTLPPGTHRAKSLAQRDPEGLPGVSKIKASIRQTKRFLAKVGAGKATKYYRARRCRRRRHNSHPRRRHNLILVGVIMILRSHRSSSSSIFSFHSPEAAPRLPSPDIPLRSHSHIVPLPHSNGFLVPPPSSLVPPLLFPRTPKNT
jgi:hypothetical protein